MNWLKDNKIFIVLIYINLMIILKLIKICYLITDFSYLYVSGIYLGAVLFYWFFHSVLKKGSYKASFIVCIFIGFLYLYFTKLDYLKDLLFNHILYDFQTINTSIYDSLPLKFSIFKFILTLVLPVIIVTILALTTWGLYNSIIVFTLIAITFLWFTGYTAEIKNNLFLFTFLTLMTYCVNIYLKNTKKLVKKGYKLGSDIIRVVAYGVVLCIIITLISSIMPQNFQGKYASDLKSRFENKFIRGKEKNEQKGRKLQYEIASSGYESSKGKLGGPISLNRLVDFTVKSDKPYYLRGNVKDFYDGFSWKSTNQKYTHKDNSGQKIFQDGFSDEYLDTNNKSRITVYPKTINASTIFTPLYTTDVSLEESEIYFDDNSILINGEAVKKPYDVEFYNVGTKGQTILNNNLSLNRTLGAAFYLEGYKKYLQLPDNISPATYDLVYSLTKDCKNELEKVQKIRNYLNKTYPYTLKVSDVPEGHEFVDYFLFTEKKGYCVYFATAATIMCRIAGVPARYVEGFNMTSEKDSDGLYVVREESAHAWTEVLYMQSPNNGLWYTLDAVPNATELVHEEQAETNTNNSGTTNSNNTSKPKAPKVLGGDEIGGSTSEIDNSNNLSPKILAVIYILSLLAAVIIIRIIVILIKRCILIRNGSVIPLFVYSTKRLESIKIRKESFTGDMEFAEKIRNRDLRERMIEITKAAYEEYYGNKNLKNFDKKGHYKFIERHIRRNQGGFIYLIGRMFYFGIFSGIKSKIIIKIKK